MAILLKALGLFIFIFGTIIDIFYAVVFVKLSGMVDLSIINVFGAFLLIVIFSSLISAIGVVLGRLESIDKNLQKIEHQFHNEEKIDSII